MAEGVIALVDDDPTIIALLRDLLGEEGFRTVALTEGAGAPATIARERPDLVVLDLWMERQESGWAIYEALRADAATAGIPVIVCSADVKAIRAHGAEIEARGDAVIEKPFRIGDLLALVARVLNP